MIAKREEDTLLSKFKIFISVLPIRFNDVRFSLRCSLILKFYMFVMWLIMSEINLNLKERDEAHHGLEKIILEILTETIK